MKQFFKMMFASTLGVFVAVGLLILISTFTLIGMIASMSNSPAYVPKANTVLKISLDGELTDSETATNPFAAFMGGGEESVSLKAVIESIEKAKNNDNIKGIYLESGSLATGSANLTALRRALIDFKEDGKFVVAYADSYTQGNYYLCSVADKVFLNSQGKLFMNGLALQTFFYKGLYDKIGFEMEVFKVGTYKGAVEPYILDKLSDANREQMTSFCSSVWNNIAKGISESRNVSVADVNHFANEGLFAADASKAVECGFIDELKYKSEAEEYVKELAGQTDKTLKTVGVSKVRNIKVKTVEKADQIAILYAEGEIRDDKGASPYSMDKRISEKVAEELKKLKDNDKIKAVVLRVNSPGGSAYISEQIWYQVVELKKVKPVVVSMGSLAASGGYYISCAADKIVAEASTLTGSIGVFGRFPNMTGTFKKVGLTTDVVKTNTYSDLFDVSRPMRDDEKALIQAGVERTYDLFITRCADGRGMTKDEIDHVGQGRVWTGEQAKERGLVDEIGGLDKAITVAAELAELNEYSVTSVSGAKDFFKDLLEKQLGEVKISIVKSVLGSDYEYVKALNDIRTASGIQARLPYDIKPL